jgi:hypothetical protein
MRPQVSENDRQCPMWVARTKSRLMFCRSERDCRPYQVDRDRSGPIRIEHRKTGANIHYPLEADGVEFYTDAEEVLVAPGGIPMVLRELKDGNAKPFAFNCMQHIVQRMRKATSKVDYVEALAH